MRAISQSARGLFRAAVLGGAALRLCSAAGAQIAPFTEESLARGISYAQSGSIPIWSGSSIGFPDIDGDGDPDLVVLGTDDGTVGIYENDGNGYFTNRSGTSGLPIIEKASAFAAGDYDGDARLDLVITTWGLGIRLFRNIGGFHFTETTAASGLTEFAATKGASWGDVNGDGWIDLHVSNYWNGLPGTSLARNRFWHNNGNGTFTNIAATIGLETKAYSFMTAITDFDEDGDLDIYLSNDRGMATPFVPNLYWRNDGGTLVEVGQQNGTGVACFSMGVAVGDLDRDGRIDLYCTNLPAAVPPLNGANPLLLQLSPGTWSQAQALWGVTDNASSWGCVFFDANLDGWQDLFVVNQTIADVFFLNTGAPPMVNATAAAALGGPAAAAYSTAVADIDSDGDLDLAVAPAGLHVFLFINHSEAQGHRAQFVVRGEAPDRAAIGSTVRVTAGGVTQIRDVNVGANSYIGQNEARLHFGLGTATVLDEVQVRWANIGAVRSLTNYAADRIWTLYPPSMLGDVNGDGRIDQADVSLLSVHCFEPVEPGLEKLDMNGDGYLNAGDAALMSAILSGALGDFDLNGHVNGADLTMILGAWGQPGTEFDLNLDGTVDGADITILLGNWSAL